MTDALVSSITRDDLQRAISARNADVTLPLYPTDASDARGCFPVTEPAIQTQLDSACRAAPLNASDTELPIWLQFVRLGSLIYGVFPTDTNPTNAAWAWSKARVFLAGAGYASHDAIAQLCASLYSVCDLTPGETRADWHNALTQAHTSCGWPANLGRLDWSKLRSALPLADPTDPPEPWHLAVALLHLLKHARTRPAGIVITYRGTTALIQPEPGNVPGFWNKRLVAMLKALGCTTGSGRGPEHPLTKAMKLILTRITLDKLLAQQPIADLPMSVIAGPWSSVEPDPSQSGGFIQADCRLAGVWAASKGKVLPYSGDQLDTVSYQWNVLDPGAFAHAKEALEQGLPSTYPQTWPADELLTAFPNIMLGWASDQAAARVLLELPLFASVLRVPNGAFANEYPLVGFLPEHPTPEGSTNQGKTRLATVYVRTMAPGTLCVVAQDSGSAPDSRAIADVILTHGTVALDEWSMPQNKSNVLNHQNIQTLCTGGTVAAGRVLENAGCLTLRHSLVASAKALDFPPDMVNRSFLWVMREFTAAELARPQVKRATENGGLAIQLRLATLSTCETFDVARLFSQAPYASGLMRYDAHMTLARVLYELRTGRAENGEITKTILEMRALLARHNQEADASGVLSGLESGMQTKVRISNLFAGMTADMLEQVRVELNALHGSAKTNLGDWNSPTQLLESVRKTRGYPSLQAMLPAITGARGKTTDRVVTMAVGSDIKQVIPEGGTWTLPDVPYTLERGPDQSGFVRIRLVAA